MTNTSKFISAGELSRETGYTPNAIRLKRKNTIWGNPDISVKKSKKKVEFNILGYNNWCINNNTTILNASSDVVQFILYRKFKWLYGITLTELSHFCEYINITYDSLLVIAPDGNKMVNLELYRKNIYSLLKFLKVI